MSAFALEPWREISRLAIDDDSNVSTLTSHADSRDTSTVPMVVEYSTDGAVVKELLPRSMFPLHAAGMKANSTIGSPSMRYDSSGLWFWLPGSTELVTVPAGEGNPTMMKTGLPRGRDLRDGPHNIIREISGNVVAQIREDKDGTSQLAYYTWSPSTKSWVRFEPGACNGDWLIGVGDNKQVYLRQEADRSTICVFAGQ